MRRTSRRTVHPVRICWTSRKRSSVRSERPIHEVDVDLTDSGLRLRWTTPRQKGRRWFSRCEKCGTASWWLTIVYTESIGIVPIIERRCKLPAAFSAFLNGPGQGNVMARSPDLAIGPTAGLRWFGKPRHQDGRPAVGRMSWSGDHDIARRQNEASRARPAAAALCEERQARVDLLVGTDRDSQPLAPAGVVHVAHENAIRFESLVHRLYRLRRMRAPDEIGL